MRLRHETKQLPTGIVTFLFTDIEGSTSTLRALRDEYAGALDDHRRLLREAFGGRSGVEVDTQGDAFFYAFERPTDALLAAVDGQRALAAHTWPSGGTIRVRMGVHAGEAVVTDEGYVGLAVHHAARVCSAAHGGQVLVSQSLWDLTKENVPDWLTTRDLGRHSLKDLVEPERLYQLVGEGLADGFAPPKTLTTATNNLPAQLTPVVGRAAETEALTELLGREDVRLVTLTGPGGVGKSRLAMEACAHVAGTLPDGLWLVPLVEVVESGLVASAIAQVLRVKEQAGATVLDTLAAALTDKTLAILLDSFEHVIDAAPTVTTLIASCPGVRFVVTSRTRLNVHGEHEFPVDPLAVPDSSDRDAAQAPAVQLFVERAQAARPGFEPSGQLAEIIEVCRALDGLPLAIELVAARIRILPPKAMLTRLSKPLELVSGGTRDAHQRQRSLAETIAWSYELLADEDKVAFERLSVFAGGCTFETAESVCNWDGAIDTFSAIESLVDKSLLRQVEQDDGEPRFMMYATLRDFAGSRLSERDPGGHTRRTLLDWVVELVASPPNAGTREHVAWLDLVEREYANVRSCLAWSIESGDPEARPQRLAHRLLSFWLTRGHYAEGSAWILRALEAAATAADARAVLEYSASKLAYRRGQFDEAARLASRAADSGLLATDQLANVHFILGAVRLMQAHLDEASDHLSSALALAAECDEHDLVARTTTNLGALELARGDLASARSRYEDALARASALGDRHLVAEITNNLGAVALETGRLDEASRLLTESLRDRRAVGDPRGIAETTANLGAVAHLRGDLDAAIELYEESLAATRRVGDVLGVILALSNLGEVAIDQERHADAREHLDEALALAGEVDDVRGGAYAANLRAGLAIALGEPDAARSVEAARSWSDRSGDGRLLSTSLRLKAQLDLGAADDAGAEEAARGSCEAARAVGAELELLDALLVLAEVLRSRGRDVHAALSEARGLAEVASNQAALDRITALQSAG